MYKGRMVAIFQCLPKNSLSEGSNLLQLQAELMGLTMCAESATNMKAYAEDILEEIPGKLHVLRYVHSHYLPSDFHWNVDGAFIGRLPFGHGPPVPNSRYNDRIGPLPFEYILVLLLLDVKEENVIRFSNFPIQTTWEASRMEDAINAFRHYAFIESDRTLVYTDLQGDFLIYKGLGYSLNYSRCYDRKQLRPFRSSIQHRGRDRRALGSQSA